MALRFGGDWKDRLKDSKEAADRLKKRLPRMGLGRAAADAMQPPDSVLTKNLSNPPLVAPWKSVSAGTCPLTLQSRSAQEPLAMQPWTKSLVECALRTAENGGVTLALVWPSRLVGIPTLHALANIERVFQKDLRGIRTLLFPGTHASRSSLNAVLADKQDLSVFYQSLWEHRNSSTNVQCNTESLSYLAALAAVNDIHLHHPEVANPSLAELVPTFIYDPVTRSWTNEASNPLKRTLSKVDRLATRKHLRANVEQEWGDPAKAPGAMLVLHRSTPKKQWTDAFSHAALRGAAKPDLALLDATRSATGGDPKALDAIPEFLTVATTSGLSSGALIVTDEPKSFFVLRTLLHAAKIRFTLKQLAGESDENALLSSHALPDSWQPSQRSNANFSVSIVDKDASDVAIGLQKLALSTAPPDAPGANALLAVARYVLQLSNLPAGFQDIASTSEDDFSSRQSSWAAVKLPLDEIIATGALNSIRSAVAKLVARAEELIEAWTDSTPMGMRLLSQVKEDALRARHGISIVLPSHRYVRVVYHFLKRQLDRDWPTVESRIDWHTLAAVGKTLAASKSRRHFLFVGINPDALRVLLTHPDVPHGSSVLVAYKQAEATLRTLRGMKAIDEFKAYRGRIGLLAQVLERRLGEVPSPIDIDKLREASFIFSFKPSDVGGEGGDSNYYRYELEGGGSAYAAGWVFRFHADDDPPFRRAPASGIGVGDFIFEMSGALRADIEESLQLAGDGLSSTLDPVRVLLSMYHRAVRERCQSQFTARTQSELARDILSKMLSLDPKATECTPERITYWLDLSAEGDTRPHAAKDPRFFKLFCRALDMDEATADDYWTFVRNARKANQAHGRLLMSRYSEILFQPESAAIYRKVSSETIKRLQQEALHCVHRVEAIFPPLRQAADSKGA